MLPIRLIRASLLLVLLLSAAPPGDTHRAWAQDRTRFIRWTYQDALALSRVVLPRTVAIAVVGGTTLLPTVQLGLDRPLLDGVQAGYTGLPARALDAANMLGDRPRMLRFSVGVFVASLATRNGRFQNAAFTSLQALIYADAVTRTLKSIVGRARPADVMEPRRFRPFSGRRSFPSGHATVAFAVVGAWVYAYPHPLTYGLFALSTGTAFARIARNRHWPTDVIAGAAVGLGTSRFLVRRHRRDQDADSALAFRIAPRIGFRSAGLSLALSW